MAPNLGLISSPRYAASFLGAFALPLIPRQKEDAQRRKLEWSSSPIMTMLVLGVPALCLPYGVTVFWTMSEKLFQDATMATFTVCIKRP